MIKLKGINYGGKPTRNNPASLALVIRDEKANRVFDTASAYKWSKKKGGGNQDPAMAKSIPMVLKKLKSTKARLAIAKALKAKGRPIPTRIRKVLEAKLGVDLSKVRIVVGKTAQKACDAAGAEALTIKNKILLSKRGMKPKVLIHEIKHTMQDLKESKRAQNERDARKSEGLVKKGSKAFEALDVRNASLVKKKDDGFRPVLEYKVRKGDNLGKIAKKHLGSVKRWIEIYKDNRKVIGKNPNRIKVGQKLKILLDFLND